jgi:hypothetical protein
LARRGNLRALPRAVDADSPHRQESHCAQERCPTHPSRRSNSAMSDRKRHVAAARCPASSEISASSRSADRTPGCLTGVRSSIPHPSLSVSPLTLRSRYDIFRSCIRRRPDCPAELYSESADAGDALSINRERNVNWNDQGLGAQTYLATGNSARSTRLTFGRTRHAARRSARDGRPGACGCRPSRTTGWVSNRGSCENKRISMISLRFSDAGPPPSRPRRRRRDLRST